MVNVYFMSLGGEGMAIYRSLRKRNRRNIRIWLNRDDLENRLKHTLGKDLKLINDSSENPDLFFNIWDKNSMIVEVCRDDRCFLPDRMKELEGESFVCIDSGARHKNELIFFMDSHDKDELPERFLRVPCFCELAPLMDKLSELRVFEFSLEDTTRFRRTRDVVQGQPVFLEIEKNRYWYLDNKHKDHYEVFNSKGDHLGEANMQGELDTAQRDKNKHYSP